MGCDIHLCIEVRTKNGWEFYGSPAVGRNYELFEKMAGVRGDIEEAISEPKGLPEDLSYISRQSYHSWGSDAHSASWLDADEIQQLREWLNERDNLSFKNDLEYGILNTYLEGNSFSKKYGLPGWIEDFRFVFWFDN